MERSNSADISDTEKSKWIVSRIDLIHKNFTEYVINDSKRYESGIAKSIGRIKEWRNYFLAAIGFCLTVLLGSTSLLDWDVWIFFLILAVLSMAGACVFVAFAKAIGIIESINLDINVMFSKEIHNIVKSQGFFTACVFDLSNLDYNYLKNYMIFTHLLVIAAMFSFLKDLKKIADHHHKSAPWLSKVFREESKSNEESINSASSFFQILDRTKIGYAELLKFVEDTLKEYDPMRKENT